MMRACRVVATSLMSIALVACGTSKGLVLVGDRLGCDEVTEAATVNMSGRGVMGFCKNLPEGPVGVIFSFREIQARNEFFKIDGPFDQSKLSEILVLVHDDWAVGVDKSDTLFKLQKRVGGTLLGEFRRTTFSVRPSTSAPGSC